MKVIDAPQGSPEWFAARAGRVTASRISAVLAKGRSGAPSATRAAYMGELIAETLTGQPCNAFQGNADTERGNELEPAARALYEMHKGELVDTCGLVIHPRIERSGASPDGLAGAGLLEIKCPRIHIHLDYMLKGEPPTDYVPQMAWQASCTERPWVDFVSYCPQMPEDLRLFIVRYEPSIGYLREIEGAVIEFLAELDEKLARVAKLRAA
jgi:putative phage-type endonuclease